jgi:hypothetical protein
VRGHVAPSRRLLIQRIVLAQAAVLPLLVGGVSLMLRVGGGLYWLVPGVLLWLLVAVVDARLRLPALGKVGGLCSDTSHDSYKYSLRTQPLPIGTANEASDIACVFYLPDPNRRS